MRRIPFLLLVLATFGITGVTAGASSPAFFTRTIRPGDRGADVLFLQQQLNKQLSTPISLQGAGSPGHETDYFGGMTRAAVIRFQEQYRSEVLSPAGLIKGTGVVGPFTQIKLLKLLAASVTVPPVSIPVSRPAEPSLPPSPTVNNPPVTVVASSPRISSFSPRRGGEDTEVVLTGSGFDRTNNTVYTGYDVLYSVPSQDGTTIKIRLSPKIGAYTTAVEIPLWMYVVNSGGESNEAVFTYTPKVEPLSTLEAPSGRIASVMSAITGKFLDFFSPIPEVLAAGVQGFGGAIQETQECHCSGTFWIKVGSPANSSFVVQYGLTQIYRYGQYRRANINVLGTYNSGGQCRYTSGYPPCRETKTVQGGIIMTLGTSM